MKRQLVFGTVFAAALAVGVSAQSGSATDQMQKNKDMKDGDTITVTGCLVAASSMPGATGTSGSTSATTGSTTAGSVDAKEAQSRFILTNAMVGHTAVVGDAGTTSMGGGAGTGVGTAGSSTTNESDTLDQFRLTGKDDELNEYLNHKVEIRGEVSNMHHMDRMDNAGRMGSAGSTAGSTSGTSTGSTARTQSMGAMHHDMAMMPQLKVDSVRDLGTDCQGAGK